MNSYETYANRLTGRNIARRKLANNTYLTRVNTSTIAVQLHGTSVVTYHADGRIVFASGGYRTMTTKARINEFSPADVFQAKGVWTAYMDKSCSAIFADGLTWTPGRGWTGEGPDTSKTAKLVKRIGKFVDAYMLAFDAGDVPKPGSGDCWGCLMVSKDGKGIMGADHLLQHLEESYFVPSLLQRAFERFPVSRAAMAYVSDKWAGTSNGGCFARHRPRATSQVSLSVHEREARDIAGRNGQFIARLTVRPLPMSPSDSEIKDRKWKT